jgi:hypothetical protein
MLLKSAEDALAITALLTASDRKGPSQSTRLKSVADDAFDFARHDLGAKSIAVSSGIDPDVDVVGDSQVVRQMLINLISEASRNALAGATLRVGTECGADCVALSVAIAGDELSGTMAESDFPIILARTLCELSGARLATSVTADGGRDWTVRFLPSSQNELFFGRCDQA